MKKTHKNDWRPLATTGALLTTTDVSLATTDSVLTTTGDHWRPLTTICRRRTGSALIMTIVLTVLLAALGTMFMLMARSEKAATSSRSDSEELKLAAESIVGTISQRLSDDVPKNNEATRFYDYPGRWKADGTPDVDTASGWLIDPNDAWLANLEPYEQDPPGSKIYKWRHISDLYYKTNTITGVPIDPNSQYAYNVQVSGVPEAICADYQKNIDIRWAMNASLADADGDGVADSRWVKVPNLTTSKGKPVYAAVRIVDNGGMLNVNTAYRFNPNDMNRHRVDGSNRMQVNLAAFGTKMVPGALFNERVTADGSTNFNEPSYSLYSNYVNNYIWPMQPLSGYTPFDISDELRLRNRYILHSDQFKTRIVNDNIWTNVFDNYAQSLNKPVDSNLAQWITRATCLPVNISPLPLNYDLQHISTIYSMDRVIDPCGVKMVWLNDPNINYIELYNRMIGSVPPLDRINFQDDFAQIAANIRDYRDNDSNITPIVVGANTYYGLERPIIFISELSRRFEVLTDGTGSPILDVNNNPTYARSYAIELYKWAGRETFNSPDWELVIESGTTTRIPLDTNSFAKTNGRYYVQLYDDPLAALTVNFNDQSLDGATNVDPNTSFGWSPPGDLYPPEPNTTYSYGYDLYFGPDSNGVTNATTSDYTTYPNVDYKSYPPVDPAVDGYYDPYGFNVPMKPNSDYYVRIDDVVTTTVKDAAGNVISTTTDIIPGDIESFTTGGNPWIKPAPVDVNNASHSVIFTGGATIKLIRKAPNGADRLVVDAVSVPVWFGDESVPGIASFQRDMNSYRWIQRMWDPCDPKITGSARGTTLGGWNDYSFDPNASPRPLQVWLGGHFRNIGDIGYIFRKPAYYVDTVGYNPPDGVIGYNAIGLDKDYWRREENVRINLYDPNVQNLFQYLTVLNPGQAWGNAAAETRVKGRININTAPWFVIAQLPWVSLRKAVGGFTNPEYRLASAIVAYRDKTNLLGIVDYNGVTARRDAEQAEMATVGDLSRFNLRELPGFASIGELATVVNSVNDSLHNNANMWYYGLDKIDQPGSPDLTTYRTRLRTATARLRGDGVREDFEERNLIFARISDLVTVRSDVFTAYILIRLGPDGPQRRMIAILDRSEVTQGGGKVKVIALQPVPDAR